MTSRTIAAGEFKATCLALLDQVARTGRELVVTKRGKAIAKLVPVGAATKRRSLSKSVLFVADDIVSSSGETWDAER